jgi:hypothetical protein
MFSKPNWDHLVPFLFFHPRLIHLRTCGLTLSLVTSCDFGVEARCIQKRRRLQEEHSDVSQLVRRNAIGLFSRLFYRWIPELPL